MTDEQQKINALCPVAGSFEKCKDCIYLKDKDDPARMGGFCRADGRAIVIGLDENGNDIQGII